MSLRYEGVRFSDGSIAVRTIATDPCDRATRTFETMRELEEDVGSADVTWVADRGATCTLQPLYPFPPPPAPPPRRPVAPQQCSGRYGCTCPLHFTCSLDATHYALKPGAKCPACEFTALPLASTPAIRAVDEIKFTPMTQRQAYVGDGHPALRRARYEPTEEIDEP